jgi:hypothetical protein
VPDLVKVLFINELEIYGGRAEGGARRFTGANA